MVGGFGLRLFNLYVTNGMAYLTHRETTDAPSLDSLYKVGRDAHGNKARACIMTEYCRLLPPSHQGGTAKNVTWKHIYTGHMGLT